MYIITKSKSKSTISKANQAEFKNERRAKMLSGMGYKPENIEAMMYTPSNNIRGQHIRKWLKHKVSSKEMDLSDTKHI